VRVLVVEDEELLAAAVADGLTAEGFDVDVAHDGPDGLWRAREGSYDAIVLDVLLPGMHGYKVCRTLRDEGVWTPILILTAKDGEYDEAEALDTGADDFLSKPFSFVVLLARLRALIRRGAPPRPTVLTVGSLELDPGARRPVPAIVDVVGEAALAGIEVDRRDALTDIHQRDGDMHGRGRLARPALFVPEDDHMRRSRRAGVNTHGGLSLPSY
jgi:DNA-binding response OmpR family regulator